MTSFIILVVCLLLLCISAHVWQFVKETIRKKGLKSGMTIGTIASAVIFSSAAGAATFIIHIAEVSP